VWQRAADTLSSIEEEVRDPQTDKPLKIEVAQGSNDTLLSIFEYTRQSVPSLLTAALVLMLTIFVLLQYRDLRDRAVRLMGTEEMGRSVRRLTTQVLTLPATCFFIPRKPFGTFVSSVCGRSGFRARSYGRCGGPAIRPLRRRLISAAFPMALADGGARMGKLMLTATVFVIAILWWARSWSHLVRSPTRLSPLAILIGIVLDPHMVAIGLVLAVPLTLAIGAGPAPTAPGVPARVAREPALEPTSISIISFWPVKQPSPRGRRFGSRTAVSGLISVSRDPSTPGCLRRSATRVFNREQVGDLNRTLEEYIELVKKA
jgi:hypothetical protein